MSITRELNTEYILSLSYGRDSIACLEAIKQLGYPLDRIVHAEVWATDTIPADLPPMVEFKKEAEVQIEKILEAYFLCEDEHGALAAYLDEPRSKEETDTDE